MNLSLPISVGLHGAVLAASYMGFSSSVVRDVDMQVIPIRIYEISDVSNVRAAVKEPELAQQDKAEQLSQTVETASTQPTPKPIAGEASSVSVEPSQQAPISKQEPVKAKPLSIDDLSALLASSRPKKGGDTDSNENGQKLLKGERNRIEQANAARLGQGAGTSLTTAYEDAIMRRVYNSWRIPSGSPDIESLIVTVAVSLDIEGKVTQVRLSEDSARRARSNDYFNIAAESAIRAVRDAAEFKFLPKAEYERWKSLSLTFHPKDAPSGIPT